METSAAATASAPANARSSVRRAAAAEGSMYNSKLPRTSKRRLQGRLGGR